MNQNKEKVPGKGRLIPEGELKCVWMMAGVVSYKLCDYQYECDNCPFDRVMRKSNEFSAQDKRSMADSNSQPISVEKPFQRDQPDKIEAIDFDTIFQDFYNLRFTKELFYHRGHTWVDVRNPNCVKMGMDDFAGKFILGIKTVILPAVKSKIDQGQVCCWIVEEEGTLPILAPISGAVISLNPQISEEPVLMNRSPYEQGWLMKIRPINLQRDLKSLYGGDEVTGQYEKEVEKLRGKFESLLRENWERIGPTLCDGGNMLIHVRDMIGPKRYFDIISGFFTGK
ncbi:MAG: glycine cleavage system protein H [candidate division KSB1 bacterium]|nr:glycine cleavage system protein H [candidate division KSB1 bacterium]